mmetsp:Transcript_46585/g.141109  ORF Transcript_46585/g.141109 Transcript_46585/m.141109 type:complete len:328 (+) Transcript_46585:2334-3317(+)
MLQGLYGILDLLAPLLAPLQLSVRADLRGGESGATPRGRLVREGDGIGPDGWIRLAGGVLQGLLVRAPEGVRDENDAEVLNPEGLEVVHHGLSVSPGGRHRPREQGVLLLVVEVRPGGVVRDLGYAVHAAQDCRGARARAPVRPDDGLGQGLVSRGASVEDLCQEAGRFDGAELGVVEAGGEAHIRLEVRLRQDLVLDVQRVRKFFGVKVITRQEQRRGVILDGGARTNGSIRLGRDGLILVVPPGNQTVPGRGGAGPECVWEEGRHVREAVRGITVLRGESNHVGTGAVVPRQDGAIAGVIFTDCIIIVGCGRIRRNRRCHGRRKG